MRCAGILVYIFGVYIHIPQKYIYRHTHPHINTPGDVDLYQFVPNFILKLIPFRIVNPQASWKKSGFCTKLYQMLY